MNKVVEGLKAAVRSARCDHDWIVQDIEQMPEDSSRIKSHCEKCGVVRVSFRGPGAIKFVNID